VELDAVALVEAHVRRRELEAGHGVAQRVLHEDRAADERNAGQRLVLQRAQRRDGARGPSGGHEAREHAHGRGGVQDGREVVDGEAPARREEEQAPRQVAARRLPVVVQPVAVAHVPVGAVRGLGPQQRDARAPRDAREHERDGEAAQREQRRRHRDQRRLRGLHSAISRKARCVARLKKDYAALARAS
jgi:hypothetical protein